MGGKSEFLRFYKKEEEIIYENNFVINKNQWTQTEMNFCKSD